MLDSKYLSAWFIHSIIPELYIYLNIINWYIYLREIWKGLKSKLLDFSDICVHFYANLYQDGLTKMHGRGGLKYIDSSFVFPTVVNTLILYTSLYVELVNVLILICSGKEVHLPGCLPVFWNGWNLPGYFYFTECVVWNLGYLLPPASRIYMSGIIEGQDMCSVLTTYWWSHLLTSDPTLQICHIRLMPFLGVCYWWTTSPFESIIISGIMF